MSVTSSGALEGLGKGVPSLVISLFRYVLIIIPAAFFLSRSFGAAGVWNAFWIAEAVTAIVAYLVYRKTFQVKEQDHGDDSGRFLPLKKKNRICVAEKKDPEYNLPYDRAFMNG